MYGLIGGKLGHSYSKMIHAFLGNYEYNLFPLNEEDFHDFINKKKFNGINVTIPYKETVIPYLDEIDVRAKRIGAVNTIINKDNKLFGYNTDYDGFKFLLEHNNINVKGKVCLILGTGGTSKTVKCVLEDLGASKIIKASRTTKEDDVIQYDDIQENMVANIIINTTPVGMYPNINQSVIDLNIFQKLEVVVDVIYNPFRTKLMLDAQKLNVKNIGGLEMLIYQAKRASELFTNNKIEDNIINDIYRKIVIKMKNIVLIGLPGSGKTTVGKYLSRKIKKPYIDIDKFVAKNANKSIPEIFKEFGEEHFRNLESSAINHIALKKGFIISTGGGIVKNQTNMDLLKANGFIIFLNRDIDKIFLRDGKRPLIKSNQDLINIKEERYQLYLNNSDLIVRNNFSIEKSVRSVKSKILKNI